VSAIGDDDRPIFIHTVAFLEATRDCSALEFGAFFRLMMHRHRHGSLPDSDAELAQIIGVTAKEWAAIRVNVKALLNTAHLFMRNHDPDDRP
jgi:uncharacterized protein YdaU (DUF1376 family)